MDFGGLPRGLGAADVEATLVSADARARMAGVVSEDLDARPRFLMGCAGVEGPRVDASEMLPMSIDLADADEDEDAAGRLAGVGAPTVELRETLPSLRGLPRGRGRMVELDTSDSAACFLDGGMTAAAVRNNV